MSSTPQRPAPAEAPTSAATSDTAVHRFNPGDLLFGRYRYEREVGRGGMGVVLLAQDEVLELPVALKVPPEQILHDTESLGNLKKEVLRGMALTHAGIVRIYSFEHSEDLGAIVMEYVDGETMGDSKMHQAENCFDCDQIMPWLEQLCPLLDYAHKEARIAHRDLKPRNILLTRDGRVKVTDFGISSSLSDSMSRISVRSDRNGTPPYMSPQQAMGERPTHLDDIYSLGATLYDLLTSRPPFFRGNVLAQVLEKEPPSMAERRSELGITRKAPIPEAWERLIAACLAKNPADRPASGKVILEWFDARPSLLPPIGPPSARAHSSVAERETSFLQPPAPELAHPIIRVDAPRKPLTLPKRKSSEPERVAAPIRPRRSGGEANAEPALSQVAVFVLTAVIAGAAAAVVLRSHGSWGARLHESSPTPAPVVRAATPAPPMPILGDPKLDLTPGVKDSLQPERAGS